MEAIKRRLRISISLTQAIQRQTHTYRFTQNIRETSVFLWLRHNCNQTLIKFLYISYVRVYIMVSTNTV